MASSARLNIVSGPNSGDTLKIDAGTCRLVGRHLSEAETVMMDQQGNRVLDGQATQILESHLRQNAPEELVGGGLDAGNFARAPDIVLSDDSISRAHAMVFMDDHGFGIVDLASTNGTFVNTNRVHSSILGGGDTLRIGSSEISIEFVD